MDTRAQGATAERLRTGLERNAGWIRKFVPVSAGGSVLDEYFRWLFERLKDRVPPNAADEELDRMIRLEVSRIFGKFRDGWQNRSAFPLDVVDPTADRFQTDLENEKELQASLMCVADETRELILQALSFTDEDVERRRDDLATHLGLTRSALDQRLSRAYRRIRDRMRGRRGPQRP